MIYRILSFILDLTKTYHGYSFLCLITFSPFLSEDSLTIGDIKSATSSIRFCFLILSLRFSMTSSSCHDTTLSTYHLKDVSSICLLISFVLLSDFCIPIRFKWLKGRKGLKGLCTFAPFAPIFYFITL